MKKQISPGALLSPVPAVLVSCGSVEKPNLLTIAWVGTLDRVFHFGSAGAILLSAD